MRWEDERYVRVYTRDTVDWQGLSFDAQALFVLLLRKVDRAGLLDLGKPGKRGVAVAIGHAREWARLEPALEELLTDGCVRLVDDGRRLLVPNFLAAQEAKASDKSRQQKSRETARDVAAAGNLIPRDESSQNVTVSHKMGQNVTTGHAASRPVTPSCAVPSRAEPSSSLSAAADDPEELPDATDDAHPVIQPPLIAVEAEPKPEKPKRKAEPKGDPRHAPLVDALVKADTEVHGVPYGFRGGRDAKAVSECLSLADQNPTTASDNAPAEVLRRWRIARRWKGFPACNSLQDLATHWNAYARAQDGSASPPAPATPRKMMVL